MNKPPTILIRTSGRPKGFARAIKSIQNQTVKCDIIVSIDNKNDFWYVQNHECKVIQCTPNLKYRTYWNLYLNDLIRQVQDNFVIILDDDDYLNQPTMIEEVMTNKVKKSDIIVWRMVWDNGRVIPDYEHFGSIPFERGHIGMPCVCFHSSMINKIQFDGNRAGDFRFYNAMLDHVDNIHFINKTYIQIGNRGLNGAKE